ncbi:MAG: hypothetical protein AAGH87_04370 [Pseudomonadota bacterium]
MSRRTLQDIRAFDFRADFAAPSAGAGEAMDMPADRGADPTGSSVEIPVMDLVGLGAQLQAEAQTAANLPANEAMVRRLERAAERLGEALSVWRGLSVALDRAVHTGAMAPELAASAARAAKVLEDGQRELFEGLDTVQSTLPTSPDAKGQSDATAR